MGRRRSRKVEEVGQERNLVVQQLGIIERQGASGERGWNRRRLGVLIHYMCPPGHHFHWPEVFPLLPEDGSVEGSVEVEGWDSPSSEDSMSMELKLNLMGGLNGSSWLGEGMVGTGGLVVGVVGAEALEVVMMVDGPSKCLPKS